MAIPKGDTVLKYKPVDHIPSDVYDEFIRIVKVQQPHYDGYGVEEFKTEVGVAGFYFRVVNNQLSVSIKREQEQNQQQPQEQNTTEAVTTENTSQQYVNETYVNETYVNEKYDNEKCELPYPVTHTPKPKRTFIYHALWLLAMVCLLVYGVKYRV